MRKAKKRYVSEGRQRARVEAQDIAMQITGALLSSRLAGQSGVCFNDIINGEPLRDLLARFDACLRYRETPKEMAEARAAKAATL